MPDPMNGVSLAGEKGGNTAPLLLNIFYPNQLHSPLTNRFANSKTKNNPAI
jgi:hypothetical protein